MPLVSRALQRLCSTYTAQSKKPGQAKDKIKKSTGLTLQHTSRKQGEMTRDSHYTIDEPKIGQATTQVNWNEMDFKIY